MTELNPVTWSFPRPRVVGGQVLYLDYDGTIHPEQVYTERGKPYVREPQGRQLFEQCDLLTQLLQPYPDVRIVLSTTWVPHYGYRRAANFLPPQLRDRCVGSTFHREMGRHWFRQQLSRGEQVRADVARRNPSAWLALDDDVEGWGEVRETHHIATDPVDGIAAPAVLDRLRTALERFDVR